MGKSGVRNESNFQQKEAASTTQVSLSNAADNLRSLHDIASRRRMACSAPVCDQTKDAVLLQLVRNEYDELFTGEVEAVHLVYNTNSLDPLVKEYDGMIRDLEDLIDDYASQLSRGKDVKRKDVRLHLTAAAASPCLTLGFVCCLAVQSCGL